MTAAISLTWLDWVFPGIHRALFLGSSWANQTLLPQHAFLLPLFMQVLSVYTMISSHRRVGPWCLYLQAIWVGVLLGSVKIWKHLARLSLQVIDGSKVITPFVSLAWLFLCFRDLVRDRPSGGSCFSGLCLGGIRFSLVRASAAHLCRFSHPIFLSFMHSVHVQFLFFQWVVCWVGWQRHADVLTRSATWKTLCLWRRHFALVLAIGFCSAERWYHTGSCARSAVSFLLLQG